MAHDDRAGQFGVTPTDPQVIGIGPVAGGKSAGKAEVMALFFKTSSFRVVNMPAKRQEPWNGPSCVKMPVVRSMSVNNVCAGLDFHCPVARIPGAGYQLKATSIVF